MSKKNKKQYVEHYEEHRGEDVAPFGSFLSEENQVKTDKQQPTADATAQAALVTSSPKPKVPFWKRLTAIFS